MKLFGLLIAGAITGAQFIGEPARAADETNTLEIIQQLQKRIEELEQKVKTLEANQPSAPATNATKANERIEQLDQQVKVLQRERELDQEAAEAKAKEAPKLTIGENGFEFASANRDFAIRLGGVLQVDSRSFFNDGGTVGNDGFLLRRARPVLQGTVFRDFDFLFVPDFGTSNNGGNGGTAPTPQIFDAYLNYRYAPELQFQAGKSKTPIGLEQLQADRDILFNERSLATDLVPTRDIGFQLHGDLFGGVASYAAGVFSGVGDMRNSSLSDFQDDKAFDGRVFFQPFKKMSVPALAGFGFGLGGSYQGMQGTSTVGLPNNSGYLTVGQQQFFAYNPTFSVGTTNKATVVASGDHWRLSPQGYYYYGPFGMLGEYVISNQRVSRAGAAPLSSAYLNNTAWEVTGSWALTGEEAAFAGGLVPRHPFEPAKGYWGAWQLVGRYSQLDIDSAAFPLFADPATSAHAAHEWSVGLNWYLNRNVRVDVSFSRTKFDGGGGAGSSPPATVTRHDENVLFTRVQLAF
jgi:phosphate-selective porin OprO/OprP